MNFQSSMTPETRIRRTENQTEHKVGIGELMVMKKAGVLRTLLGSCIGLALHDPANHVGGLAHIVLPASNDTEVELPGKYADTALPELIRLIELSGGKPRQLTAKLAGGANMFAMTRLNPIGEQNLAVVEALLKEAGIPILGRHCGGKQGRRLAYDVATGIVIVESVGQPAVEL